MKRTIDKKLKKQRREEENGEYVDSTMENSVEIEWADGDDDRWERGKRGANWRGKRLGVEQQILLFNVGIVRETHF